MDDFIRNLAEMNPFSAFLRGVAGLGTSLATLVAKNTDALDQYNAIVSLIAGVVAIVSAVFGALYLRQAWKNSRVEALLKQRQLDEVSNGQRQERTP